MNNNTVLKTIYKKLSSELLPRPRKDYWSNRSKQEPRSLVNVLEEWVPELKAEELTSLPHLDDPVEGLYKLPDKPPAGEGDLQPNDPIIVNSFKLLGDCLTTALVCYRQDKCEPQFEEMLILVRLAARALEFKEGLNESQWRMRHKICSFFAEHFFFAERSDFPKEVVSHAVHQFILYWWAIPQKYKDELFNMDHGDALGLKGDFILLAADIVRNLFSIGQKLVYEDNWAEYEDDRAEYNVTTYHSVKGGTGKSTLALAHAIFLSKECIEEGKGKKVAILDLDMINPSLLAMHGFVRTDKNFVFLDDILSSLTRLKEDDLKYAFVKPTKKYPILLASFFGPSRGRDKTSRFLMGHIDTWQVVTDNLRAVIEYLFVKRNCKHIVIDNSAGFFAVAIPSAIVTAERRGTFVLVSTLDAFDAGSVPIAEAAYDYLFRRLRRVMVFNKCPVILRKEYEKDRDLILSQAWSEAFSRAGIESVVDVLRKKNDGDALWERDMLFVNTHKMRNERGPWGIEFLDILDELASVWALTPDGRPGGSFEFFVEKIDKIGVIKELSKYIMTGGR